MNKIEYLKIKKIIDKYFKNNQCFDKQVIYDIIELIIKTRKYDSMIDSVNVSNQSDKKGVQGYYSPLEKNINVVLPSDRNDVFDYNTTLLHTLFHELEHVGQHKKCLENEPKNLETDLLSTCFKSNNYLEMLQNKLENNDLELGELFITVKQLEFYEMYSKIINKQCYELLPSERQAEIKSFKYLIELLKKIDFKKDIDKMKALKTHYLIRKVMGYKYENDIVLAPTYELYRVILKLMNQSELQDEYFDNFDLISKQMPLEHRLYYGLRITPYEYKNQITEISERLK